MTVPYPGSVCHKRQANIKKFPTSESRKVLRLQRRKSAERERFCTHVAPTSFLN